MRFGKASELDAGNSTRCGRCADLLPDETMTFCPSCGVPFSEVPPTNSYESLLERSERSQQKRERFKSYSSGIGIFLSLWTLVFSLAWMNLHREISGLSTAPRVIAIYTHDFPEFPKLEKNSRRQAIAIALQAFEDHFGIPLKQIEIHEDSLPTDLLKVLAQAPKVHGKENEADLGLLSYWEQEVYPRMTNLWQSHPGAPLPVVLTNLPIFVDRTHPTGIQTEHLGASGLISGLGHPSLVIVSSYRVVNERKDLDHERPYLKTEQDRARYVGEYLLAHELGHAILGLTDYVTEPRSPKNSLRSPASIDESSSTDLCLMHTDRGGGAEAWARIRLRPLGQASPCHAYDTVLKAFKLRAESIGLLKSHETEKAALLHEEAIESAANATQAWVAQSWNEEHRLYLSLFRSWWSQNFVFQSRNDSN